MKNFYLIILSLISVLWFSLSAQTALPYTQGFENTNHGWTLANGTQTNGWFVGTAVANGGTKSLYISNDSGVTNNYTNSTASTVHAYKDFIVPIGVPEVEISFDWRALGESCCDYIRVWLVPTSFTPTVGTQIGTATDQINLTGNLNMDASFKRLQFVQNIANYSAAGSFRLVFEWRNDGSLGTMPAGAIDNVDVKALTCFRPLNTTVNVASATSVDVVVTPDPASPSNVTYEYEIRTAGAPGSGATGLVQQGTSTTPNFTVSNLQSNASYNIYVRTKCSATDKSLWVNKSFFVIVPENMPYSQSFETATVDWVLSNGTEVNKWVVGTAVANSSTKSLYVSNDNGVTNNYTINTASVVHAFKDFNIPTGIEEVALEFDWKGGGESSWDFLTVWLVPTSFNPTTGTRVTASADRVDLFGLLNLKNTFQRAHVIKDITKYTNNFRVVFEWRNDGSGGTMPAIAVDNINVVPVTCYQPINLVFNSITKNSISATITPDTRSLSSVTFEYEVRTSGGAGSGPTGLVASGTTTSPSFTVANLQPETNYQVYVRTVCSATDKSLWSKEFKFMTLCNYSDFTSYTTSLDLCGPQKAELNAVVENSSYVAVWFDTKDDLTPLYEGANFMSPNDVTQNRSFWLRSWNVSKNTPVTVGTGTLTTTGEETFLIHFYGGYKHQFIFTAAELIDKGLTAGPITALKFDVVTVGTAARNDFSIAMGTTTQSVATGTHVANANLTQVYSNASETFAVGTKTFTFTTPFVWDGVSNIVVQTNWSNQNTGGNDGALRYHTTSNDMNTYTYADSRTAAEFLTVVSGSVNGSGGTSTIDGRPNTVFVGNAGCVSPAIEIPVTVAPKPLFDLSTDKVSSCDGNASSSVRVVT
ncbi:MULTISPECIES: fibronectin type III domain-containing protein, partial [unclassified Flavobacterium]